MAARSSALSSASSSGTPPPPPSWRRPFMHAVTTCTAPSWYRSSASADAMRFAGSLAPAKPSD
eukprot:6527694-Prymnesium_polylepis.1